MTVKHSDQIDRKDAALDPKFMKNESKSPEACPNNDAATVNGNKKEEGGKSDIVSSKASDPTDSKAVEADVLIKVTLKPLTGSAIEVEVRAAAPIAFRTSHDHPFPRPASGR